MNPNAFKPKFGLVLLLVSQLLMAQKSPMSIRQERKADIERCVRVLAHDSLEGREAGTVGEMKAYRFISKEFKQTGLDFLPGCQSYLLPFNFNGGYRYEDMQVAFNGKNLTGPVNYFFATNSVDCNFRGSLYPFLKKGMHVFSNEELKKQIASESVILSIDINLSNVCQCKMGETEFFRFVTEQIYEAASLNPSAIILLSSDFEAFPVKKMILNYPFNIPVLMAGKDFSESLGKIKTGTELISTTTVTNVTSVGHNVVGWIDNKAPTSIIIGAHFDHLGYGDFGSRYTGFPEIHNGADDNASGTSLMIELAKVMKSGKYKNHNYIFAAFSGEEKGLLGSKDFIHSGWSRKLNIVAMLNFDMVGRADPREPKVNILGTGTSPIWDTLLIRSRITGLEPNLSAGGLGGSDQFSFYNDSLPVLFFITGLHGDYHVPTDDAEKINFDGINQILSFAEQLLIRVDSLNEIPFTSIKQESSSRSYTKGVTIGVIPDHTFSGKGMRIDGVSSGRPAEKAGLQKGDVIVKMGDNEVTDMASYMTALSKFKKGDITKITYLRGDKTETTEVQF